MSRSGGGYSAGINRAIGDVRYAKRLSGTIIPLQVPPAIQVSPPTIGSLVTVGAAGVTATTGSSLTSPRNIPYHIGGVTTNGFNATKFTRAGWTLLDRFGGGLAASPGGYTGGSYPAAVEFLHYGIGFELRFSAEGASNAFQVFVDGLPASASYLTVATSAGAATVMPITFATRASRQIRLEFTRLMGIGAVIIAGDDLLAPSGRRLGPQIYVVGDSYCDGANGVGALDTWPVQLGRLLDADMWVDAMGGTGLVATGGGGAKAAYLPRVTAAGTELRLSPDLVIIQGSTNDANGVEAGVPAAGAALITQIQSQWPNAKIIVTGVLYPRGTLGTGMAADNASLAAILGVDLFINPIAEGWFNGNTTIASPSGTVNSNWLMSSDGVHGTSDFHTLISSMIARRITELVHGL